MKKTEAKPENLITLPEPQKRGPMSLEEVLDRRQSIRRFSSEPLSMMELSQLLWAAQGITRTGNGRTSPSAGALYPLEIYVSLREGLYRYVASRHQLIRLSTQNLITSLAEAALGQSSVREAPAVIVIAAIYERIESKYGERGERYVKIEVGHAAQNVLLQAVSLGLGAVPVGAYYDGRVHQILNLPLDQKPLYLIPVGHPRE